MEVRSHQYRGLSEKTAQTWQVYRDSSLIWHGTMFFKMHILDADSRRNIYKQYAVSWRLIHLKYGQRKGSVHVVSIRQSLWWITRASRTRLTAYRQLITGTSTTNRCLFVQTYRNENTILYNNTQHQLSPAKKSLSDILSSDPHLLTLLATRSCTVIP